MTYRPVAVRLTNFPVESSDAYKLPSTKTAPPKKARGSNAMRPDFIGGPSSTLPRTSTSPTAVEILYHRLQINTTAPSGPFCEYAAGSGIRHSSDIAGFMDALENGTQTIDRPLYNMSSDAPNIVVRNPCYIIVEIYQSPNVVFEPGTQPIETQTDYSTSYKYCDVCCYDTSWDEYDDTTPADPCSLMYFECREVTPPDDDYFNFYLQIGLTSGGPSYLTLDPALKNRGPKKTLTQSAAKR